MTASPLAGRATPMGGARSLRRPVPSLAIPLRRVLGRRAARLGARTPDTPALRQARRVLARLGQPPGEAQLMGYTRASVELTLQRQMIYAATLVLSVAYYDVTFGVICYLLNVIVDVVELRWSRRLQAEGVPAGRLRREYRTLLLFTIASSAAITFFVVGTAALEGLDGHFTPLFFLLAAAIFATMNNHQIPLALGIRLFFYGCTFLYVPGIDLWTSGAPLGSVAWLYFFTAVFVLFFILDCARVFLGLHRENVRQFEALRAAEAHAVRALALQTQFISVVSHELRTPLTSINGAIALAQSGRLGAPPVRVAELLSVASRNGKRLAALVNDILDVQKLAAGEMRFTMAPVDLGALVAECIEVNTCLSEDVQVVRMDDPQLGTAPVLIMADRHRLLQVLTNIVSNAVKFSPSGGRVELTLSRGEGIVGLAIRDHGRGIPPGSEGVVFGQFTQVDSSDRREKQGSGLGMNIARRIMDALGGTIRYESEMGVGTTFFLEFRTGGAA